MVPKIDVTIFAHRRLLIKRGKGSSYHISIEMRLRFPLALNSTDVYVFAARYRTSFTRRDDDNGALYNAFNQPLDNSDNCHGDHEWYKCHHSCASWYVTYMECGGFIDEGASASVQHMVLLNCAPIYTILLVFKWIIYHLNIIITSCFICSHHNVLNLKGKTIHVRLARNLSMVSAIDEWCKVALIN